MKSEQAGGSQSQTELAKLFGTSKQAVYNIANKLEHGTLKIRPKSVCSLVTNDQPDEQIVATYTVTPMTMKQTESLFSRG